MQIDYNAFLSLCMVHGKAPSKAAEEAGIARNQPGKWKKGAAANPASIRKLADYFGVDADSLLLNSKSAHTTTASGRSVILQGNTGNTTVSQGSADQTGDQLTDMEKELLRIFRSLDMRKKNILMSQAYDIEDSMKKEV